jgi:hypothetical protein
MDSNNYIYDSEDHMISMSNGSKSVTMNYEEGGKPSATLSQRPSTPIARAIHRQQNRNNWPIINTLSNYPVRNQRVFPKDIQF